MLWFDNHIFWDDERSILICGEKGAGKTAVAVRILLTDRADRIAENIGLNFERFKAWRQRRKDTAKWAHKQWFKNPLEIHHYNFKTDPEGVQCRLVAHECSVRAHDEMPIEYQARDYSKRTKKRKQGIEGMKEERKFDSRQVSTTQMYRDLDVLASGNHSLVVQIRSLLDIPFLGWVWPDSVRPVIICGGCGKRHRHGKGSRPTFLHDWFGFGTLVMWDQLDPELSASGRTQSATDEDVIVRSGFFAWSQEAAECYRTFGRVACPDCGDTAAAAVGGGGSAGGPASGTPPPTEGQDQIPF